MNTGRRKQSALFSVRKDRIGARSCFSTSNGIGLMTSGNTPSRSECAFQGVSPLLWAIVGHRVQVSGTSAKCDVSQVGIFTGKQKRASL